MIFEYFFFILDFFTITKQQFPNPPFYAYRVELSQPCYFGGGISVAEPTSKDDVNLGDKRHKFVTRQRVKTRDSGRGDLFFFFFLFSPRYVITPSERPFVTQIFKTQSDIRVFVFAF